MEWWQIGLIAAEAIVFIVVSVLYFRYKKILKCAEDAGNTELFEKKSGLYIKWFIILTILCIVFAVLLVVFSMFVTHAA